MIESNKSQPAESEFHQGADPACAFKDRNEPMQQQITEELCVIRDSCRESLAVKVGVVPMSTRPVIPMLLTSSLLYYTVQYLPTAVCTQDSTRHVEERAQPACRSGPNPQLSANSGSCHHIHLQHCAQTDLKIRIFLSQRDLPLHENQGVLKESSFTGLLR